MGIREKDPTLRIGLNLAEMLKQSGAKYITRKNRYRCCFTACKPTAEDSKARVDVGNKNKFRYICKYTFRFLYYRHQLKVLQVIITVNGSSNSGTTC